MPEQTPDLEPSELEALLNSKTAKAVLDVILSTIPSLAYIALAPDGRVLRMSDDYERLIGWRRSIAEGHTVSEWEERLPVYDPSGRLLPASERPMSRALRGETVTGFELLMGVPDGERIPGLSNAAPIRNARGKVIGAIGSVTDVRPQKALERSLREAAALREALYRELAHRVKNHLQMMSGLISLEARDPALSAAGLAKLMKERLRALAAVYDRMIWAGAGERIAARAFVEEVCGIYAFEGMSVQAAVDPPDLTLTSDQAGPVGMLVNEAVNNSVKHAFAGRSGHIWVTLRRQEPGRLRLEIADDGVGWRAAGPVSRGLDLLRLFADQLHGKLKLADRPGGGAVVAVDLPEAVERTQDAAAPGR